MKRGRPSKRGEIRQAIMDTLDGSGVPLTISALSRLISEKHNGEISWNTVHKYVRELVEANKITPIVLPHSKEQGKNGLIVYTIKKQ